jgi:transposase
MEPTGNYHKPLIHWLTEKGYLVVFVAGNAVKDNRELLDGRWDKNDTKDSANVADLISQGKCLFYENPEADILALRNLLSVRRHLKKEIHRLRMRIRNGLLAKYFPEMDRHMGSVHYRKPGHRTVVPGPAQDSRNGLRRFCPPCHDDRPGRAPVASAQEDPRRRRVFHRCSGGCRRRA